MMRYLLLFLGLSLLAACSVDKEKTSQRIDFVGNTRFTAGNRTGLGAADTVASRLYAEATDAADLLTRLRITVSYTPRRNPLVYPSPASAVDRSLIDSNPDPEFIYLDTLLDGAARKNLLFTSVFGVRTTAGSERWEYSLRDAAGTLRASRAFRLSMRRADSLTTYQDYTLKLPVPATGPAARRFLHLRPGLALPAYTVLNTQTSFREEQAALQDSTDLIVLADGLTITSPDAPTLTINAGRWPADRRRATRIYRARRPISDTTFVTQLTDAAITAAYNAAVAAGGTGQLIGPVARGEVYAFRTDEQNSNHRYGLLLVVSVPTSTTAVTTSGLQLRIRMAKSSTL